MREHCRFFSAAVPRSHTNPSTLVLRPASRPRALQCLREAVTAHHLAVFSLSIMAEHCSVQVSNSDAMRHFQNRDRTAFTYSLQLARPLIIVLEHAPCRKHRMFPRPLALHSAEDRTR